MLDHIEQLVATNKALTKQLKTCRMAQAVMDNTVADLKRERDTLRLVIEANIEKHRSRAEAAEAKLATCEKYRGAYAECDGIGTQAVRDLEAKLAKVVEALWEWDDLIKHQYSGSREAMSDMTYAAQHTAALLAEIEGEKG
jgi:hypothetical protein